MIMRRAAWLCRWAIGLLFIAASIPKIADPAAFARVVHNYQLLPDVLVNLAALYLPWLELLAGLALLLVPRYRDAASWLLLVLLLLFTAAIAYNIHRGISIACGCFSVSPEAARVGWRKVAENVLFIVAAGAAYRQCRREAKEAY